MRAIIKRVWQELQYVYNKGSICSERHMQAELFRLLRNDDAFNDKYQIFVEPIISGLEKVKELNGKIPDFIFINKKKNKVCGVLEMKYVPHHYPKYEKDMETLRLFSTLEDLEARKRETISLKTDPGNGNWSSENRIKFAKRINLIYCAVGKFDSYCIENNVWNNVVKDNRKHFTYMQFIGAIGNEGSKEWGIYKEQALSQN